MSDILRLREQLSSTWPREEIDLEAVARLIGGLNDRPLVAADVLRDDATVLRNAEREGASLAPGYAGLLADRLDDVLQHLAAEKRGHEHYMDQWSEVCNENQGLLNTIERLQASADEYDAWIRFQSSGDGDFDDFIRQLVAPQRGACFGA